MQQDSQTGNTDSPLNETESPARVIPEHARTIRSYVMRAGRTTEGQARALADLGPQFVLPFAPQPLDFVATFGRPARIT
jgi:tRNA (guanine-N7-)-methyltransferase